jgi:DNA-binding PadR family transcriptional regulator
MYGRHGFRMGGRGWAKMAGCEFPRMRRGDMKFLLLEVLKEGPRHGYEMIGELENRFRGYRPSPGSVYPTLQMLEEGGFVTSQEVDGKKVYTITDAGRTLLEERGERHFEEASPELKEAFAIRESLRKLAGAVVDGARGTDEETLKRINGILNKARKEVYSILAE